MVPRAIAALCAAALISATAVLAHSGVKDPNVQARMQGMNALQAEIKVLGQMAKGTVAFAPDAAKTALQNLQKEAAQILPLFEPNADDPKSEAKAEIWTDWESFTQASEKMNTTLAEATVSTPDALARTLRIIASECSACHRTYRE